jgi:hypothetical protein
MDEVLYYPYDFHLSSRETANPTHVLLNSMSEELTKIGFCWIDKSGQCVLEQKGIIRTNCVGM